MNDTGILLTTAASIAVVHTALGADHTLPFIALGKARAWGLPKTLVITALCGVAHVLASVVIGVVGIGVGRSVTDLLRIETARGELGVWLLVSFGLVYAAWGAVQLARGRRHSHAHVHVDGAIHTHDHDHEIDHSAAHAHPHDGAGRDVTTAWLVFLFLVFGPCEALIPLMTAPALAGRTLATAAVVVVFAALTIATMLTLVTLGWLGARATALASLDRYVHVLAGLMVAMSGVAVWWIG